MRQLRKDLLAHGVERVWLDEAEIDIGDSLIAKIEEGMKLSRYIAVVLSRKSIDAPWVKKELDVAMNREIASGEVVVLPLLNEECELPEFLKASSTPTSRSPRIVKRRSASSCGGSGSPDERGFDRSEQCNGFGDG